MRKLSHLLLVGAIPSLHFTPQLQETSVAKLRYLSQAEIEDWLMTQPESPLYREPRDSFSVHPDVGHRNQLVWILETKRSIWYLGDRFQSLRGADFILLGDLMDFAAELSLAGHNIRSRRIKRWTQN